MKSTKVPEVNVYLPGVNLNSIVAFVSLFSLQGGFVQPMILKSSESGCGPPETKTHRNYTVIIHSYHLISLYELHYYKNNMESYEHKLFKKQSEVNWLLCTPRGI